MNVSVKEIFDIILEHKIYKFIIPVVITLIIYSISIFVQKHTLKRIKKSTNNSYFWQMVVLEILSSVKKIFIFAFAVFFSLLWIEIPIHIKPIIHKSFIAILLLQLGQFAVLFLKIWLNKQVNLSSGQDLEKVATINLISIIGRVIIYSLVFLLILNNLGVDITALIAGLGVGGIAIALAVQNILSDLFSSLTIILDKPFKVGDFIVIGEFRGTVENIGLKTTRLRSISGEQLVIGNADLLQSRIQNFKQMEERRVLQSLTVVYQTSPDVLEKIPSWIYEIVAKESKARFERCHFLRFLDSSLEFELVYWVGSPDYLVYAEVSQSINLAILRKFTKERVDFAYPTRTIFAQSVNIDPPNN